MTDLIVMLAIVTFLAVAMAPPALRLRALKAAAVAVAGVAQRHGWTYMSTDGRWATIVSDTPPAVARRFRRRCWVSNVVDANIDGTWLSFFHLAAADVLDGRRHVGIIWAARARKVTDHTFCALRLRVPVAPMAVCSHGDWAARRLRPRQLANHYSSGDPAFDQQFVLTTGYPGDAAQVLTPELRHLVASIDVPFMVTAEGYLLTWRPGLITDGEQLVAQGRALAQLAALLVHR
jgi:hypothetical protein